MGLVEVLQDDGDVHVDDDHEVDDDERHEEDDGDKGEAAVAVWQFLVFWITVGRLERESVFKSYQTGMGYVWPTVLVTFKLYRPPFLCKGGASKKTLVWL